MPPSSRAQLKAARGHLENHSFEEALAICKAILEANANDYNAKVLKGAAQKGQGDHDTAIASYISAATQKPALPLAHKAILSAVDKQSTQPSHLLALARAHLHLCDSGPGKLSISAQIFYKLASSDPSLIPAAVSVLTRFLFEANGLPDHSVKWSDRPETRIIHLLSPSLPEEPEKLLEALEEPPLGPALDAVQKAMSVTNIPVCRDVAYTFAIRRAILRCHDTNSIKPNLDFLRDSGAHDELLSLAETDTIRAMIPTEHVVEAAFHALHVSPTASPSARSIVAAQLQSIGGLRDVVESLAGLGVGTRKEKMPVVSSVTDALVKALLHLQRGEYKLAADVAAEGQQLANVAGGREWMRMVLHLLIGKARCGDRKYKEASREYAAVRVYAQKEGDAWLEAAANRGLVETAVIGHGRRSRQTSIAVEEAAGSANNVYGVLECVWTDALAGDVDCERMAELTGRAVIAARNEVKGEAPLAWVYEILDTTFSMSSMELAATASTRFGQMLVLHNTSDKSILERAQRCQMEAASLFKGLPNPFAQLGWIFEQLAKSGETKKMLTRAIRCYEKAMTLEPAHPIASRRLARILMEKGLIDDAAEVARQASERDPGARWAYNLVGWSRIRKKRYKEATVCFRNAMRGRPKLSAKNEESLFGTDVGRTAEDNDLLVDVDSWRGMSSAYRSEGKFGPAIACTDDAIALLQRPPMLYTTVALYDIAVLQDSLMYLLETEKGVLLQAQRQSATAVESLESLLHDCRAPFTIKNCLSEAYVWMAANEWVAGSFHRATMLRVKAAQMLEDTLSEQGIVHPYINPASSYKRLGDTFMEAATTSPRHLKRLVPGQLVECSMRKAVRAYSNALHYTPWEESRSQDLAAAMIRTASLTEENTLANDAVSLLLRKGSDPAALAISFMALATIRSNSDIAKVANTLSLRVSNNTKSKKNLIALNASIAIQCSKIGDIKNGGKNAVSAIRHDPTDWRGWYAIGIVREADAHQNGLPIDMLRTSEKAYSEADRLGAGPLAAQGVVRCGTDMLRILRDREIANKEVYSNACFYAAAASRAGLMVPELCQEIIDGYRIDVEGAAISRAQDVSSLGNPTELHKHVHLYPFLKEVSILPITPFC